MQNVPQIAHALQEVLSETALQAGRESGFIQRQVKLTGARRRTILYLMRTLPLWKSD